jgi:hypothetical protein
MITAERSEIGGGSAINALLAFKYCNGLADDPPGPAQAHD